MRLGFSKLLNKLVVKYQPKRALFKERLAEDLMRKVLDDCFAVLLSDFLYKNICCGYSFELPHLVEAIQMSSHNICFYKEVDKSSKTVI